MIDLHLHTSFSHDSTEDIENYLTSDTITFVTTDHADFVNVGSDKRSVPSLEEYSKKIEELKTKYPNIKFYKGMEIGFNRKNIDEIQTYINDGEFDLVLLSFHDNGEFNYMGDADKFAVDDYKYISDVLWGVKNYKHIDVITHLDYAYRKNEYVDAFFEMPILFELFNLMKEKGIALEINTGSIYRYDNKEFIIKLIEAYRSNGNTLISLGSDTHSVENHRVGFEDTLKLLDGFELLNWRYDDIQK